MVVEEIDSDSVVESGKVVAELDSDSVVVSPVVVVSLSEVSEVSEQGLGITLCHCHRNNSVLSLVGRLFIKTLGVLLHIIVFIVTIINACGSAG